MADRSGMKAQVGAERLYAETQPGPAPPGAIASGRLRKSDGHAGEPRPTTASSAGACNQTDRHQRSSPPVVRASAGRRGLGRAAHGMAGAGLGAARLPGPGRHTSRRFSVDRRLIFQGSANFAFAPRWLWYSFWRIGTWDLCIGSWQGAAPQDTR